MTAFQLLSVLASMHVGVVFGARFETINLDEEVSKKGNDERPEAAAEEQTIIPDAVSQACTDGGLGAHTSVFTHVRLGNYTAQELMNSRCDEPLLVLLQRELMRIEHLSNTVDEPTFTKLFPLEFALDAEKRQVVKSAVMGSLDLATLGTVRALDLADNIFLNGDSIVEYVEFLKEDHARPQEEAEKLAKKGATVPTTFWRDVPLGVLLDVHTVLKRNWMAYTRNLKMLTRAAALHHQPDPDSKFGGDLPSGTFVDLDTFGNTRQNNFFHVLADYTRTGWVEASAIGGTVWVKNEGKRVPLCTEMLEKCPKNKVAGHVESTELVKVEGLQGTKSEFWLTAGSQYYIPRAKMSAPVDPETASEAQEAAGMALGLDGIAVQDGKIISGFNAGWNSKAATHGKMALGIGLLIGGIVTHGLLFLVAGLVYGVGSSATDAALAMKMTELALGQTTYMELALLNFERQLFDGTTAHKRCNIHSERPLCASGFTCFRDSAFGMRFFEDDGYCVRSPWEKLTKGGEPCAVDLECESGECEMASDGTLAQKIVGVCKA